LKRCEGWPFEVLARFAAFKPLDVFKALTLRPCLKLGLAGD
jgi:hypothetical protein